MIGSKKSQLSLKDKANYLLLCMAILYSAVFIGQLYIHDDWYGAIYWIVQSALIGSVADWFAVTALFRRPLGVSFHTELIPRNKKRLIDGLVNMVETKLLTYEKCEKEIHTISFVSLLDQYITSDTGRITIRQMIRSLIDHVWHEKTDREWARWGATRLREFLHKQSLVGPLQQFLTNVSQKNEHEELVIKGLRKLHYFVQLPAFEQWIVGVIEEEIEKRKQSLMSAILIGLSEGLDIVNARDMAKSIISEISDLLLRWQEPNSWERILWMKEWAGPLQAMTSDIVVRSTLRNAIDTWIDEENWEWIIEECVCPHITDVLEGEEGQSLPLVLEESLQQLWVSYRNDETIVRGLEEALTHMALHVLEKSHSLIGKIVREVLEGLSTEKFIYFVESKVEDDLSWIRINGAMVGAVCGGLVWLFLTYVYNPFLHAIGL